MVVDTAADGRPAHPRLVKPMKIRCFLPPATRDVTGLWYYLWGVFNYVKDSLLLDMCFTFT